MPKRRPSIEPSEQKAFGAYLRSCREANGLPIRAVAIKLPENATRRPARQASPVQRANANQVRAWEAGDTVPSVDTLKRLAAIYGCSRLEFWVRAGYVYEILPFIVALLKLARIKRLNRPFEGSTFADVTSWQEPPEGKFAIWLALRAFSRSSAEHDEWGEIPSNYEDFYASCYPDLFDQIELPRLPTRLPPMISRARRALIDRAVSMSKRRQRAAHYFQDWLEHFEPALYRICYAQTYGEEP